MCNVVEKKVGEKKFLKHWSVKNQQKPKNLFCEVDENL